jgi:hypothetical protein
MKKVRYAIGALGLAPVLAVPFAHAVTPGVHVSGKSVKRVNLADALRTAEPALSCFHSPGHSASDNTAALDEKATWDDLDCVWSVRGETHPADGGLWMRVREYSHPGGTRIYSKMDKFEQVNSVHNSNNWTVGKIDTAGTQVCIAIVPSSDSGFVLAGPNCVST